MHAFTPRAFPEASKRKNLDDARIGLPLHPVAQRPAENRHIDLEYVAQPGLDARRATQNRRAKEIGVQVTGPAMAGITKMVMLQIADRVGHVVLATQELAFPQDAPVADHPRSPLDVFRQIAEQQFWTQRAGPEFRMSEIKIVHGLGHLVGKLVAQAETDP